MAGHSSKVRLDMRKYNHLNLNFKVTNQLLTVIRVSANTDSAAELDPHRNELLSSYCKSTREADDIKNVFFVPMPSEFSGKN